MKGMKIGDTASKKPEMHLGPVVEPKGQPSLSDQKAIDGKKAADRRVRRKGRA